MNDRKPLPPDAEAVRKQYGGDAELYAEGRADAAKALGLNEDAAHWEQVTNDIVDDPDED